MSRSTSSAEVASILDNDYVPDADLTIKQIKVLEYLLQNRQSGHDVMPFHAAVEAVGMSANDGEYLGDDLEDLGLIEDFGPRPASGHRNLVRLTAAGRRRITQVAQERENPASRQSACRRRLLIYADREPTPSPWPWLHTFVADPEVGLHGMPFSQHEAHRAALHLAGEGLLDYTHTAGDDGTFKITHLGSKCVTNFDGDVSAWERHQMRPAGHQTTINQGPGSSANAVVGHNISHISQVASASASIEESAKWVEDLRQILPLLQLPTVHTVEIEGSVARLQAELEVPSPAPSRVRQLGQAVIDSVVRALPDAVIAQAPLIAAGVLDTGRALFG